MYMTVSKISRTDGSPCSLADMQTIVPSFPSWDAYSTYITTKQAEGKVIYRSSSINNSDEMETVTLYLDKSDYDTFKLDASWAALEADLLVIYNPAIVTEEVI